MAIKRMYVLTAISHLAFPLYIGLAIFARLQIYVRENFSIVLIGRDSAWQLTEHV